MSYLTFALTIALATVLLAEFVNGWTDAPNVIATVVSTGGLSPRTAIAMAVVMNTLGAMAGTEVAATVGKGIVAPVVLTLPAITGAMLSIVAWGTFAAKAGLPVSKSHALLAGLAGAAFQGGGWEALYWDGWVKVGIGLFCSLVLGFAGAFVIGKLIIALTGRASPTRARKRFDYLQIAAAAFMAFNHGLNDGQKFMGVFALTMIAGGAMQVFEIPFWIVIICALTMGLGTSCGGWRIIQTIGMKLTRLTAWQGFAAQFSASCTIFGASIFGIPLSTTHTITTAIVGATASRRTADIRLGVLRRVVLAWIVTFPVCAVLAYGAAWAAEWQESRSR